MKKIVYCVFILIICSTLVLAEQTLMSYSISEGGSVGGMSKVQVRFHTDQDLQIERLRFYAREQYSDDGGFRPAKISITSKTLSNPIAKVWDENFKISQCENIKQTVMEVLDKKYLYDPIDFYPEYGWNYVLFDEPIKISAGQDFFIEFEDIQMDFSDEQVMENTFVFIENIKDKEYIGLPRNSYCLTPIDFTFKDKKVNVWVEINPSEYSKYKCNETDGGKNYNVGGWVSLYIDGVGGPSAPDICSGINVLSESYCPTETSKEAARETYICPGVCVDKACVMPTVCPAKITLKLNKKALLEKDGPIISINTFDENNKAIKSIINAYLYKEEKVIEAQALEIPLDGFKFDTKEMVKDVGRLKTGMYSFKFNTSVSNCEAQSMETFEIKESMDLWERFVNFLKSLFS